MEMEKWTSVSSYLEYLVTMDELLVAQIDVFVLCNADAESIRNTKILLSRHRYYIRKIKSGSLGLEEIPNIEKELSELDRKFF